MTSTDYEHPYRPLGVRAFNRLSEAGASFGLPDRLDVDALRAAARRKTGLSDFGDDGHAEALGVLVASINDEARLTPVGRVIQKSRLTDALVQRLRIQDLVTRHPEIEDIDLGTIILVTGLQRTGTTLLQRLLCSHPQIRGITGAEALVPVATGETAERSERSRRWRAMLAQRTVSYLAPDFQAIHPVGHDQAEEDVLLLDLNFMSQTAEATMTVPSYSRWLEDHDHTQNYEFLRRVLQVLAWQRATGAWVLKTPHHLEFLDAFCKSFGSATVVQAHRDPRVTLASFCSMVAHGHGIFSDSVNAAEIGRHWCRKTQRMVQRAMQVRAGSPAGQFVDVSYYDLMTDPIGEAQRVCEAAGVGFDGTAERQAEQYLAANPQNRFGTHDYQLEDFELTEQGIDETFAAYREAYTIPFESDRRLPADADAPPSSSTEGEKPASEGLPERGIGDRGFVGALATAVRDLRNPTAPDIEAVADDVRIDGKTCLVTGANSGLGRAAAVELARRGGRMILACRPGHDGVCEEIKRESGSETVELVEVDLADLRSVHRCCDELRDRGVRIDIALMNAGLMTPAARRSAQGYDEMFAVHFLANRVMIDRWLSDGVVVPAVPGGDPPRIVFVSSEAHRSGAAIDFDCLGEFASYGMKDSMRHYGLSKLALCTYATELSRRLNRPGEADEGLRDPEHHEVEIAVHALCPGGVATNITRGAPAPLRSVVDPLLRLFFRSPDDAIEPIVWLCCAPEAGSSTGLYLHLMHRKQVSESAADPANGAKLWEASQVMVEQSRGLQ
ncbi:SDR family NAD(P)-dependent oxidoreductase [Candidatus Poriferisodalis sp.]|uniref:SDR family NAD(P)-dependent oxidoreductase n=1 Tax=Candidatus Poriferisodalis sp. TaxID=3101277 RepID=UPI003B0121ED